MDRKPLAAKTWIDLLREVARARRLAVEFGHDPFGARLQLYVVELEAEIRKRALETDY